MCSSVRSSHGVWCITLAAAVVLLGVATPSAYAFSQADLTGKIAFSSKSSGNWDIWVMSANGSSAKRLTKSSAPDVDPRFSPSGNKILFSSIRGGKHEIRIIGADGTGEKRICAGDQADWAPSGKSIVFRRNWQIVTRNLATGEEKVISPPMWKHCVAPAWSPSGKKIAFAARLVAGYSIYVVDLTTNERSLVIGEQGSCEPHWSPSGNKIAYQTDTHIFTISPSGANKRQVTTQAGIQHFPEWSADGTKIVYSQGSSPEGPWVLYAISASGGTPVKLLKSGSPMNPDWH